MTPDMVEFKEKLPEYVASSEFTGGIVYVDAKLTPEIEAEGYAREVIRRIQDMRKDLDLDVDVDMIKGGFGARSEKPFSRCPYCGEELKLPKTPKFCPYCGEQLME
ncbi:MAG: DUF5915 domain-containing protein [Methanosarcinales archaeon]